jgi:AraC-like DNA-binding protein
LLVNGHGLCSVIGDQRPVPIGFQCLTEIPAEQLESTDKRDALRVEAAIRWYRENLADSPGVADVAKSVNMSPSHLRRLFLHVRKENPHQGMAKIRLQHAVECLTKTDFKLDYIASSSGYVNSSDFCRVFKATYGMSPDKWRKAILPPHDPNTKYTYNSSDGSSIFLQQKPNIRKRGRLSKTKA